MSVDTDSFDGPSDVWEESLRRARKEHRCDACREPILRGQLYHVTRSLYDGRWETIARCARCETMYRFLADIQPVGEVCAQRLDCGHDFTENFDREAPLAAQALAFLTPEEAQLLAGRWPAPVWIGPREAPEATLARIVGAIMKPLPGVAT